MQVALWPTPGEFNLDDLKTVFVKAYSHPTDVQDWQCYEIDADDFRYLRQFRCRSEQVFRQARPRYFIECKFEWEHLRGFVARGAGPLERPGWRRWSGCPDCAAVLDRQGVWKHAD